LSPAAIAQRYTQGRRAASARGRRQWPKFINGLTEHILTDNKDTQSYLLFHSNLTVSLASDFSYRALSPDDGGITQRIFMDSIEWSFICLIIQHARSGC